MTYPFDETTQQQLVEIIRRHAQPLQPLPTGVQPRLKPLNKVRAVLFDIYGTLLISGSGDVGTSDIDARPAAFGETLAAVGITFRGDNAPGIELLAATIEGHHARDRQRGMEFPEVDIRDVWRDVLSQLVVDGLIAAEQVPDDTTPLALEYEVRTNPVAPMPGCPEVLDELRDKGMLLGLVSNAQVFTRLLFPALFERSLHTLGIPPELCAWSYQHRRAKPGTFLYEQVRDELQQRGVAAHEVLYVGNDRLKDIWPASKVGFRTALFAGDARSYRPRDEDPRLGDAEPDLVLSELAQLPACVLPRCGIRDT